MIIRTERVEDKDTIWFVHAQAFDTEAEARLVDALRDKHSESISLVAEINNKVVTSGAEADTSFPIEIENRLRSPLNTQGCDLARLSGVE